MSEGSADSIKRCELCKGGDFPHWDVEIGWAHMIDEPIESEPDGGFSWTRSKKACPQKKGAPKFLCIFCEHQASMEYYKKASTDECFRVLALWKTCTEHGQELGDLASRKEIEATVA